VSGPATEAMIGENLTSMTTIAKANGIRVVLASVTPVCDCFTKQTGLRPQGKIIGLNGWIRDFAAALAQCIWIITARWPTAGISRRN